MPCFLGVVLGMGAMMTIVALGLGRLIVETPLLAQTMQWVGAAFLLWLSWKIATAKGGITDADAKPVGFLGTVAFQWINPKSWLVCTGAAATYLTTESGDLPVQALTLGALFIAAAAPGCFLWLALGAALQRYLQSGSRARVFNVAMAVLLAGSVAMFIG
jgi:threonine/homoserine/homoserine lactone efflux protein